MLEFTSFIILYASAILSIIFSLKLRYIYILFVILHFVIVRYAGFDADINVYASVVHFDLYGFYYWREPIIWFGLKYVNEYMPSIELTFLFFDTISIVIIYFAFKKLNLKLGHFFGFFLISPVLLGYENVYRQYHSLVFSVLLVSYVIIGFEKKHGIIALLSGACHNVSLAFTPMFLVFSQTKWHKFVILGSLIFYPILLQYGSSTKSAEADTGSDLALLYIIVITIISATAFLPFKHKNQTIIDIKWSMTICYVISLIGFLILEAGISERFTLFAITINLVFSWYLFERFWKKLSGLITALSVTFASVPILFVDASYFIQTS